MNWSGFSSEHIQKMKVQDTAYSVESAKENKSARLIETQKISKAKKPIRKISQHSNSNAEKIPHAYDSLFNIPDDAKLSPQKRATSICGDNCSDSSLDLSSSFSSPSSTSQYQSEETSSTKSAGANNETKTVTILVGDDKSYKVIKTPLDEELSLNLEDGFNRDNPPGSCQKAFLLEDRPRPMLPHEKTTLEQFHKRQKLMEEENQRRKELLTKALADRKRQTQFEAKKLIQIQEELSRLDALLSTDVGILRNQIETASYEFNEAQKRYDQAENEFIEAKLQLFNKLERKDLLTEHLCRIIEVNEQRKAKKLSELMAKLEISEGNLAANLSDTENYVFPHATSLNEITYTAYTTLKHPSRFSKENSGMATHTVATKESQILNESPKSEENVSDSESHLSIERRTTKMGRKPCEALESLNLITAQNLYQRNDGVPCHLNDCGGS